MKKSVILTLLVAAYLFVLFLFFVMDASELHRVYDRFGIINDNVMHVGAFFFLAFLVRLMFTSKLYAVKHPLVWSLFASVIIATIIEIIQFYIPSRHPTWLDYMLHIVGIFSYSLIDFLVEKYFVKHVT